MSMPLNPFDLWHVRIPTSEGVIVLELLPLTSGLDTTPRGSVDTPQSDVAIIRAGKNILVVRGESSREYSVAEVSCITLQSV